MDKIVATFYLEPLNMDIIKKVCAESSTGTWVDVKTMKSRIRKISAYPIAINRKKNLVKIAYPVDLFEDGNNPQLLSSVAGNIFGMKILKNLRLVDIEFPNSYLKHFQGPKFGLGGVRKHIQTLERRRPHIGTIVKPKVGLNPKESAKVAYEAWVNGIDFVKDDENLTNQKFCSFKERVVKMLEMRDKAASQTAETNLYAPNITAPADEMLKRAEYVKDHGGNCIMIDIVTVGFSGLQFIRDQNLGMIIHGHRAMHGAFTRNQKHGISMVVLAKLARLAGVDQLHIGTFGVGKMRGAYEEDLIYQKALTEKMGNLKTVFPVASGGLCAPMVKTLLDRAGTDIVIQAGGGIHGHPGGTIGGALSMRQAVEAYMNGLTLKEAKTYKELAEAYNYFK